MEETRLYAFVSLLKLHDDYYWGRCNFWFLVFWDLIKRILCVVLVGYMQGSLMFQSTHSPEKMLCFCNRTPFITTYFYNCSKQRWLKEQSPFQSQGERTRSFPSILVKSVHLSPSFFPTPKVFFWSSKNATRHQPSRKRTEIPLRPSWSCKALDPEDACPTALTQAGVPGTFFWFPGEGSEWGFWGWFNEVAKKGAFSFNDFCLDVHLFCEGFHGF